MISSQDKLEFGEAMKTAAGRHEIAYTTLPTFKKGRDYQGHIRKILLEDVLDPGEPMWYEKDPEFAAVTLSKRGYAPYAKVEGSRIELEAIPVVCWARVPFEEGAIRRYNIYDRAQVKARAEMAEKEDYLGFKAVDYAGRTATGHNTVVSGAGGLTREKLAELFLGVEDYDAPVGSVITSASGLRDIRSWGREEFGPTDQDTLRKVGFMGDIWGAPVHRSKIVKEVAQTGKQWVGAVAEPEFSGVLSIRIDLDTIDQTDLQALAYTWLYFEFVNPCIIVVQGVSIGDFTGAVNVRA